MSPTLLLGICIAVCVLGLLGAVLFWIRGRRGRSVRCLALSAAVAGLYLTGLIGLLVNAGRALVGWARGLTMNSTSWIGLGLIALAVLLWLIGGYLISRRAFRLGRESERPSTTGGTRPAVTQDRTAAGQRPAGRSGATAGQPEQDAEMDEIEALLKKRGIE